MKQKQVTDEEIAAFIVSHLQETAYYDGIRWHVLTAGQWKPSRGPSGPIFVALDRIIDQLPDDPYWQRAHYKLSQLAYQYQLLGLAARHLRHPRPQ